MTSELAAARARGNALRAAAQGGHGALVDYLLSAGAQASEKDEMTGDAPLHAASSLGHVGVVRSLLRGGAAKDEMNWGGSAPLHLAAEHGHLPVVRALLAAGADVSLLHLNGGRSALMLASRGGHFDIVATLIQHGADANGRAIHPQLTALHGAVMGNHAQCVTALIEAGADIEASGEDGSSKHTPLHVAAMNGSAEIVSILLRHGAVKDPRNSCSRRHTPLHLAIAGKHIGVVEALLSAGTDVSGIDGLGDGYVSLAARAGDVDVLKSLIGNGGDVNAVHASSLLSALHEAADSNKVGAIDALVEAGADPRAQDAEGKTPLHYAARNGSCEALVALLRHGCDKDKADQQRRTPLHAAARKGEVAFFTTVSNTAARYGSDEDSALDIAPSRACARTVEVLVQHGADVNATTSTGETALHAVASRNKTEAIDALIRRGAVVDAQNEDGITPLMMAADYDGDSCAAMLALLQHGANVNARDAEMNSPLHWAALAAVPTDDFTRKVEVLLEWDADEMAVDADGLTALQLAEEIDLEARGLSHDEPSSDRRFTSSGLSKNVRDLFAQASAERRNRVWRRRRLPVLWRAQPGRFQPVHGVEASAGGEDTRDIHSRRVQNRAEAGGGGGQDGRGSGDAGGALMGRVAGLEVEAIFRNVVMFL